MSSKALVSVLVPTYNGAGHIGETLESILAQTYGEVEAVVIDDGSTDGTPEVAEGFGPRVRCIRQANAGTAAARNTGLKHAKGEFIALLDHDDLWLPEKLERQIPRFAEDSRIGLVVAWMEVFDSATGEVKGTYEPPAELGVHDMLGYTLPPVQTMVFRRSALEKIGGFDATCLGTDDWDINIRIAKEYRVVSVAKILARARMHSSQQGKNGTQMYKNCMRVLDKHEQTHPGCAECRKAVRKSRKLVRQYYYDFAKGRARSAWEEKRYAAAAAGAVWAFWQYPPALKRVLGRALTSH